MTRKQARQVNRSTNAEGQSVPSATQTTAECLSGQDCESTTSTQSTGTTTVGDTTVSSVVFPTTVTSSQSASDMIANTAGSQAAAASTGSTVSANSSNSDGVPTATLVGAAVGAAIGGALIAALITWLFMRKRNRGSSRGLRDRHSLGYIGADKISTSVSTREIGASTAIAATGWQKLLPQPIDDNSLRMQVKTLFDQIELHIENFYSDVFPAEAVMTPDVLGNIEDFDSQELPSPILDLIQETNKPTSVIKRALAQYVVSNISVAEIGQTSFLPAECSSLAFAWRRNGQKPGPAKAFSQWRVLTTYLRPDTQNPRSSRADLVGSNQDSTIRAAATQFSATFSPWASPTHSEGDRVQSLMAIMRSAAQVGLIVFSQPSDYAYVWTSNGDSRASRTRRIVVMPGMLKVTNDQGHDLSPASTIVPLTSAEV